MINNKELNNLAEQLSEQGMPFAIATVVKAVSPTSAKPGAKSIITLEGELHGWIGGGCAQPAVRKAALEVINSGQPQFIRVAPKEVHEQQNTAVEYGIVPFKSSCPSGGTLEIFIEAVEQAPQLLIVGSSPVAQALSKLASAANFDVVVAAKNIDNSDFPEASKLFDHLEYDELKLTRQPMVVVATQGRDDIAGMSLALQIDTPFTAVVASQKKAKVLLERMSDKFEQSRLARVTSPAGVDIATKQPIDVAIAILAQLIDQKNTNSFGVIAEPDKATNSVAEVENNPQGSCCGSKASAT
ncbi:MAG: XdhC family protein [Kangiellaceae bacterium]|jgi:xanthine dehydrogenase accessory factor|nr:XdhC family protein [Kangiellaceae bacterium]